MAAGIWVQAGELMEPGAWFWSWKSIFYIKFISLLFCHGDLWWHNPSFLHLGSFSLYPKHDLNSVGKQNCFLLLVHGHRKRPKWAELSFLLGAGARLTIFCVSICAERLGRCWGEIGVWQSSQKGKGLFCSPAAFRKSPRGKPLNWVNNI